MARRAVCVAIMALALVPALSSEASAGGSTLTFPRQWYRPGQWAVGRGEFWARGGYRSLSGGPYYGVLVLEPRWWNHLRTFPADAVRLGRFRIGPTQRPDIGRARLAFRVPQVPPGEYGIAPCASPCGGWTAVGDLVGSWFTVGSPVERQLEAVRRSTSKELRTLLGNQVQAQRGLTAQTAKLRELVLRLERGKGTDWDLVTGWAMAGVLAATALALALRRRGAGGGGVAAQSNRPTRRSAPGS